MLLVFRETSIVAVLFSVWTGQSLADATSPKDTKYELKLNVNPGTTRIIEINKEFTMGFPGERVR